MAWTWDPAKAAINLRKHGIPFTVAALALNDPLSLSVPDPHPDGDRWKVLCQISRRILLVVTAISDDEDRKGRIISARKATPRERSRYDERR